MPMVTGRCVRHLVPFPSPVLPRPATSTSCGVGGTVQAMVPMPNASQGQRILGAGQARPCGRVPRILLSQQNPGSLRQPPWVTRERMGRRWQVLVGEDLGTALTGPPMWAPTLPGVVHPSPTHGTPGSSWRRKWVSAGRVWTRPRAGSLR